MRFPKLLMVGLFASLAACGGGGDSGGGNPPPPPPPPPPPTNTAPTVNAGTDRTVVELSAVQLSASANDVDGDPLTYSWTQTVGTNVTLTNADMPDASFTAPDVAMGTTEDLTFRLTVSDGAGGTGMDDIFITVQEPGAIVILSGVAEFELCGCCV